MSFAIILITLAVLSVVVVLALGLHNLARGGNPKKSQKLMRLRVILQFGVIVLIGVLAALGYVGPT